MRRTNLQAAIAVAMLLVSTGALATGQAAHFPLRIGPTGRYLVDARGKPFLVTGESPQAMMVNITEADAEMFFANRQMHGFNAVWINLICAPYTGGRADGSTIDGTLPFTTVNDFSTPNPVYFTHCDRVIRLAAKHGLVVFLDPAETGSYLAVMQKNGEQKCLEYGRYLGKRYAGFPNIIWQHGNDYGDHSAANDLLVTAIARGIMEFDHNHLHTIELNPVGDSVNAIDDERWRPILGLNASYTYGPTQVPILQAYRAQHAIPTYMVESGYEFEHLRPPDTGTPHQLRVEEYMSDLSGSTGQLYGNGYTWPFKTGWQQHLDTPGSIEMKHLVDLLQPRAWYRLAPDLDHKLVTAGYGDPNSYESVGAASTPDGTLAMVYIPTARSISVDMSRMHAPVLARWFDPASGLYRQISDGRLPNSGTRSFTTPGDNADGPGNDDWVLVLETGGDIRANPGGG